MCDAYSVKRDMGLCHSTGAHFQPEAGRRLGTNQVPTSQRLSGRHQGGRSWCIEGCNRLIDYLKTDVHIDIKIISRSGLYRLEQVSERRGRFGNVDEF
jgi:hypothetical protein